MLSLQVLFSQCLGQLTSHIERIHHRKWLSFDLNVACDKVCWRELAKSHYGVPRPWNRIVCHRNTRSLNQPLLTPYFSEGAHGKEHYLICGVHWQGDFTRSLDGNLPTNLWTRQLKVVPFVS
jgi:hypothetical protein